MRTLDERSKERAAGRKPGFETAALTQEDSLTYIKRWPYFRRISGDEEHKGVMAKKKPRSAN